MNEHDRRMFTQSAVSGVSAANPFDYARRAAPVILKVLQVNYPQVLFAATARVNPTEVYVAGQWLKEHFHFYVPQTVLAAGYSPTLTFVDAQVDAFVKAINARHYGYAAPAAPAAVSYAPLETPAPRSPICPCGIDRRDCEYHA